MKQRVKRDRGWEVMKKKKEGEEGEEGIIVGKMLRCKEFKNRKEDINKKNE